MTDSWDNQALTFDEFVLDESARTLSRHGTPIALTPKEFDTLVLLVRAEGRAVAKDFLVQAVWKNTFVGDSSLARNISVLRKHIGQESIQTLPKFGYRFSLPVRRISPLLATSANVAEVNPAPGQVLPKELTEGPGVLDSHVRWTSRILAAALVALIVLGGAAVLTPHAPRPRAGTQKIAVLPFRNRSQSQQETDYIRDGFAEEMTNRLGQLSFDRLQVLARGSSGQYLDAKKAPRQIAEELGANYLLDGTLAFDGTQLHLNVQLIDGTEQTILWSREFTGPISELPLFEDQVVEAVAASAHASPQTGTQLGALPGDTESAEAHEVYLQGRYLLAERTLVAERHALERFQRAATLDPHYARAYEGIAETYIFMGGSILPEQPFAKAKEAALTAIQINGNLAEAHRDLAYAIFTNEADISGADAEYRRAVELNPDDARAHHWYAQLLASERRYSDSLREATIGYQLDPRSVGSIYNYGFVLIQAGHVTDGIRIIEDLLKREPQNDVAWGYLGTGYAQLHEFSKSADAYLQASKFSAVKVEYRAAYAYALAMNGEKDKARAIVRRLEREYAGGKWIPGQSMMAAYIGLGDRDRQLLWLRRGLDDRSIGPFEANTEPIYSACRNDPLLNRNIGHLIH